MIYLGTLEIFVPVTSSSQTGIDSLYYLRSYFHMKREFETGNGTERDEIMPTPSSNATAVTM